MSARNLFGMVTNVSKVIGELQSAGMRIEVGDDFSIYRQYRMSCQDRYKLYPSFDTACSFIDETNGFWVCGFNDANELIHTQAVRLLDLSGISLGKHLDVHRHMYIEPDTTPDPGMTFYRGPDALQTVSGSVAYCGDFWLRARGISGPRSQGATSLLSRLVFELLQQTWKPDFAFAFVANPLAAKGAPVRYGYAHCEPGNWLGPDQQVTIEEYLIWMNARDMQNVVERDLQSLRSMGPVSPVRKTLATADAKA